MPKKFSMMSIKKEVLHVFIIEFIMTRKQQVYSPFRLLRLSFVRITPFLGTT